jgi:hypothetical protein
MDDLEQAQAMVGELAAMIEHYCTVEGGVAAAHSDYSNLLLPSPPGPAH